jgi:hypothetical protein
VNSRRHDRTHLVQHGRIRLGLPPAMPPRCRRGRRR